MQKSSTHIFGVFLENDLTDAEIEILDELVVKHNINLDQITYSFADKEVSNKKYMSVLYDGLSIGILEREHYLSTKNHPTSISPLMKIAFEIAAVIEIENEVGSVRSIFGWLENYKYKAEKSVKESDTPSSENDEENLW